MSVAIQVNQISLLTHLFIINSHIALEYGYAGPRLVEHAMSALALPPIVINAEATAVREDTLRYAYLSK